MVYRFAKDKNGGVIVVFSLLLTVILAIVGIAIDFSRGYQRESKLQAAVDAAALAAAQSLAAGANWREAKATGESYFQANAQSINGARIEFKTNGGEKSGSVVAQATAPWDRTLTRIISDKNAKIKVKSNAISPHTAVEIIFLADVSYSMGIGATRNDVNILQAKTGCAFACHRDKGDTTAQQLGVSLRIDVVRSAYTSAIEEIEKRKKPEDQISVGLITYSNDVVDLVAPTSDLSSATSSASKIKFPDVNYQGGSDMHAAAAAATKLIKERRSASDSPTTYVVVWMTDGVESTRMLIPGGTEVRDTTVPVTSPYVHANKDSDFMTFATDLCDGIKTEGGLVMVLNTEYVTEGYYDDTLEQMKSIIFPYMTERFEKCASSPQYARRANDPDAIIAAARDLTNLAISKGGRLTN